jgi:hypothetical protein
MSTGLRSAGDFMANLASGAWDTTRDKAQDMKESIQSNSVGVKVSANIDAERAENKAKWATDNGGGAGGSSPPGGEGNNGGNDAGSGDAGGSNGGGTPPPLPTDSASSAAISSAQDGGGTGGIDWGGSISGNDPAMGEWNDAIKNHDPSKVGLPES